MARRPSSIGSVLKTQEPVLALQAEIAQTKLRVQEMEARLQAAVAAHREQIKRSLLSRDRTERQLAQSIAAFWEVTVPQA
jgi:predicted  nucleic acid-binding Zn-ribbon protein